MILLVYAQSVKPIFMNVSKNPKNPAFGKRVETLMKQHFGDRWGNKTAFAAALDVTNGEITTYLAGTVPQWTRLLKMSQLFAVTIEYLLQGPAPEPPPVSPVRLELNALLDTWSEEALARLLAVLRVLESHGDQDVS